jgi:N-acetylmuramoyl-L-alanine amidase
MNGLVCHHFNQVVLRCLLLGVLLVPLPLSARPADKSPARSHDYVRLSEWAREHDLELRWVKRDETLLLTGSTGARISLTVDSREAAINGINVLLLFPLTVRGGVLFLSKTDTDYTLTPLTQPPAAPSKVEIRKICLDPGHGGKDPGYRVGGNQEKKFNLLLAEELQKQLVHAGFKVSMTRASDKYVDLPERPDIARRNKADLFVSLHFNAAASSANTVHGSEVYCLTPAGAPSSNVVGGTGNTEWCTGNRFNTKNVLLGYEVQKSLAKIHGMEDRGVKRARFWVLRDATMPAILIEGGFLSHPEEGRKILDAGYRREMARAVVNGLLEYKKRIAATS